MKLCLKGSHRPGVAGAVVWEASARCPRGTATASRCGPRHTRDVYLNHVD